MTERTKKICLSNFTEYELRGGVCIKVYPASLETLSQLDPKLKKLDVYANLYETLAKACKFSIKTLRKNRKSADYASWPACPTAHPGFGTGGAIVKTAKGIRADMIVIGARGLGAAKEKFLGSTSNYVMHKAKMPVLIVK